ncbi:MAG: hypothetical protein ACOVQR_12515 [Flavobacterium sp.]|jgi:hypothetical protein|uniref:hypothetical protein n=1 Tax=Flavobacterium sp. TaxID=239 RepID=UPI003BA5A6CF
MRKKISIELFEEGVKANVYSYRINNGDLEYEKFIDAFIDSDYSKDYDIIDDVVDKILLNGAQERYFRPEGKMLDYLFAIPQRGLGCELRVFCLRINENILILGNGGIKPKGVNKYQDDPTLNQIAEEMQIISHKLLESINNYSTTIYQKEFIQIQKIFI